MGIEAEQLVLDYLSKVGDLAQQHALPSGDRMRLVTQLRARIDRVRSEEGATTAAAVRRILDRFGAPGDIVEAAVEDPASAVPDVAPEPPKPTGLTARLPRPRSGLERKVPRPRREAEVPTPPPATGASPPHLAGADELGPADPDWWRVDPGPFGSGGLTAPGGPMGDIVPGFTGGIEIPELLRQPRTDEAEKKDRPATPETETAAPEDEKEKPEKPTRAPALLPLLRTAGPLAVLAIAALLAGAILGEPLAVAAGLLLAYGSRSLSRNEAKWVALWLPATVGAGMLVWLYGRVAGKWGEPLKDDAFGTAVGDALPWAVRVAAVASALYLLWRARRRMS
ncbi:hypothetical protein SRB5_31610 [Streptomyces sp. RB5]|uniref:Uncharacterized protein n=1 Tax=Streptomyces smaragdinus TaxID=2585196 RepID=A0A7K0CHR0_9ACTN|nr:hypothetical protein [Streptomyces smaragdinus]MQY13021.1 hypothetical protein [Streptomyces smaragdinus]